MPNLNISIDSWKDESLTLDQSFRETAKTNYNQIALIDNDQKFSYKQLDEDSNKLANFLTKSGATYGDYIGIYIETGYLYIISCLASLKSGCPYIHMDILYNKDTIKHIINDSLPKIILSESKLSENIILDGATIYEIDDYSNRKNEKNIYNNPTKRNHLETAIIGYTSGSTGLPKGVKVSHKAALFSFEKFWEELSEINNDKKNKFGYITYLAWDALSPLLVGATGITIPTNILDNIELLLKFLNKHKVNHIFVTPTFLKKIFRYISKKNEQNILENIHIVWIGGEKVEISIIEKFGRYFKNSIIINNYGPTEFWVVSQGTININNIDLFKEEGVPVGKILPEVQYRILDRYKKNVDHGTVGYLYVTGPAIANGYIDPVLTKKKFLNIEGKIYFATNDLCKIGKNNELIIIGRNEFSNLELNQNDLLKLEIFLKNIIDIDDFSILCSPPPQKDIFIFYSTLSSNLKCSKKLEEKISKKLNIKTICIKTSLIPSNNISKKKDYLSLIPLIKKYNDNIQDPKIM